ncbi:hypothetical protein SVAN01_03500 [Stagonosporopsis vannaccii]|nr:hypothetical protein SVAN01_03500 [Stagonosporopsis vannaccii]
MADHSGIVSAVGRNRTIAQDLEKLPLELIEQVIREATFERVIRLSHWAGLRLTQACTISPSWRHLMGKEEDRKTWQTCLRLTDDLNVLCFKARHGARPIFDKRVPVRCRHSSRARCLCDRDVSFLQRGPYHLTCDVSTMQHLWLDVLSDLFRLNCSHRDLSLFEALHDSSQAKQTLFTHLLNFRQLSLSANELDLAIQLYQRALATRQIALANELRRLATLYEAHHSLLKLPFAPQNSRVRAAHVLQQFRSRARKLERAPLTLYNRANYRTYFQDHFPALVPYDWTLRFFVAVLGKEQLLSDKRRFVLDGIAYYFLRKIEFSRLHRHMRTVGTPWFPTHHGGEQPEFLAGKSGPTRGREGPYATHTDIELTWLESFVEVVADLMERFPQAAEAAQAGGRLEAGPNMLADLLARSRSETE